VSVRGGRILVAAVLLVAGAAVRADEAPDLSGPEMYQHFCAGCHGPRGRGNGPVARTLKAKVPDLSRIAARNGGSFDRARIRDIVDGTGLRDAHGTSEMPV
jgi:mono/diheme cytochrome c family protein